MALEAFLVIPSGAPAIPGEVVQDEYFSSSPFRGATVIPVSDFAFGSTTATTVSGTVSGAAVGKAVLNPLTVHKLVDRSSGGLFSSSCTGRPINVVQLYLRRGGGAGKPPVPYLAYEFQTVYVTEIDWSSGDAGAEEEVTFAYVALQVSYRPQNPDGSLAQPVKAGWSLKTASTVVADSLVVT